MDTVTGPAMAKAMAERGGISCLHRFETIDQNIQTYKNSVYTYSNGYRQVPIVSIGIGDKELERAEALYDEGAEVFCLDVAHGATSGVVRQIRNIRELLGYDFKLIVGNFATKDSFDDFLYHVGPKGFDALKIGVGGGSACLTRKVTGCGLPTLASILEFANCGYPIIADGGIRDKDDFCKALAAGASAVMLGKLLAGCDESPGETFYPEGPGPQGPKKSYRGSASAPSYDVQGKRASWRTPEGDSFSIPACGPVRQTLDALEAGLRSSMSYVGAKSIPEYYKNTVLQKITPAGAEESKAHGKGL
jgi:IMP dehydrogenase